MYLATAGAELALANVRVRTDPDSGRSDLWLHLSSPGMTATASLALDLAGAEALLDALTREIPRLRELNAVPS